MAFLKIGKKTVDAHAVAAPKEMYSTGGFLEEMPVVGVHLPGMRTKISRSLASSLLQASCDEGPSQGNQSSGGVKTPDSNKSNKGSMSIYINDLIDVVKKEIIYASRQADKYTFTQRAERMLRKAAVVAIKGSLRDLVDAWVEPIGEEKEAGECMSTPSVSVTGTRRNNLDLTCHLFSGGSQETPNNNSLLATQAPLITPPVDLTDDVEADESDVDIVLTQLKEQTILQNLLHKRLFNDKQRALTLEHKNGRKLRVILPPESTTAKAFVEEAKKSRWIKELLPSDVHQKGMLQYLAVTHPAVYVRVANQKNITLQSAVLSTPQTIALGRLSGINDTQMSKIRSFLKNVGKAELKYSKSEICRFNRDVGLHPSMPQPIFNNYTLEWATTNGKGVEKKLPEACNYWNADLLLQVAAEVDLVMSAIFLEKSEKHSPTQPTLLDYRAPGFEDKPGITVLFGGDHGAGACPCSLKINSSPADRKARGKLNWRCPTVQIASIDCTKDSFELLSNTVMPRIREQLIQLRNSCVLLVYRDMKARQQRKAFVVPKNFLRHTLGIQHSFLRFRVDRTEHAIDLRHYFDVEDILCWASFRVSVVISNFNDLYVGDLAFLAMATGMNNSSGAHCIHCLKKASKFNCDAVQPQEVRTKASLTACLNESSIREGFHLAKYEMKRE